MATEQLISDIRTAIRTRADASPANKPVDPAVYYDDSYMMAVQNTAEVMLREFYEVDSATVNWPYIWAEYADKLHGYPDPTKESGWSSNLKGVSEEAIRIVSKARDVLNLRCRFAEGVAINRWKTVAMNHGIMDRIPEYNLPQNRVRTPRAPEAVKPAETVAPSGPTGMTAEAFIKTFQGLGSSARALGMEYMSAPMYGYEVKAYADGRIVLEPRE